MLTVDQRWQLGQASSKIATKASKFFSLVLSSFGEDKATRIGNKAEKVKANQDASAIYLCRFIWPMINRLNHGFNRRLRYLI